MNLRPKLALVAAGLAALGTVLGLVATYFGLLNLRMAGLDDDNRLLADLIVSVAVLREDEPVRVPVVVGSYLSGDRAGAAAQAFVDGQLVWSAGLGGAPRPLDAERLLAGEGVRTVDEWRVATVRDEDAGVAVQVGRPLVGVREVLGPFPELALGVLTGVALLAGALAWWSVGIALRPLRRLTASAERFGSGAEVPAIPGRDEPARLARAFGDLLARLRDEREREHRFLAYAAHELRTPISALRAGLEAAAAGKVPLDAVVARRLGGEARRLEDLAQNLLALSSAEAGDVRTAELDLERLAADAYDRFLPLALERGLMLDLETEPARAVGDARLIEQALANLVANALRATREGGATLRTGTDPEGFAWIEIRDTGPGIRLGDDSVGLGLRVVRAVAAIHGGEARFTVENGTAVRLRFPTVTSDTST